LADDKPEPAGWGRDNLGGKKLKNIVVKILMGEQGGGGGGSEGIEQD